MGKFSEVNRSLTNELCAIVAERLDMTQSEVYPIVREFLDVVALNISLGDNAWYSRQLGLLYPHHESRNINDPRTGDKLGERPMRVVRFKASDKLRRQCKEHLSATTKSE